MTPLGRIQPSPSSVFAELNDAGETVEAYFDSFNRGCFTKTSQLFCPDGCLQPPFEDPVCGPEAIAQYLHQEAEGMKAQPISATLVNRDFPLQVTVKGKVTALVFTVNVAWDFILNCDHKIIAVKINLLASLEELFKIRSSS